MAFTEGFTMEFIMDSTKGNTKGFTGGVHKVFHIGTSEATHETNTENDEK